MKKQNQFKHKINSLKLLQEKLKGLDIIFEYDEDENGHVLGMLEGVKKMNKSTKKITNQDIVNLIIDIKKDIIDMKKDIDKKFDNIEKDIVDIKKDISKINSKIDLMIQAPTMNREIDHKVLAKIDAR